MFCLSLLVCGICFTRDAHTSFAFRCRCLPISSFVVFFGGRSRARSRVSSKTSAKDSRGLRFGSSSEVDHRAALLAGLDDEDDDEGTDEFNQETDSDLDRSSQGGSGHNYRQISALGGRDRDSVNSTESCDTTSTGFTVYRNTATTSEFSSSYRPHNSHHNPKHISSSTRKSESMSGSIIVNALMWPIGSAHNPHRTHSSGNLQSSSGQTHSTGPLGKS